MKKTALVCSMALGLGLTLARGPLRADSPAPQGSEDTVVLKDGRVLHGEVVEESQANVVVLAKGVQRKFGRSLIKKIVYGSDPDDAAPDQAGPDGQGGPAASAPDGAVKSPAPPDGAVPARLPRDEDDLVADLSDRYQVPPSDVLWVRRQGIPDADLPLVFLVAAQAQVTPRSVVKLRLDGYSWGKIEDRYGLNAQYIYYEPGPWVAWPYYYPYLWGWYGGAWGWGWGGYGRGWGGYGHGRGGYGHGRGGYGRGWGGGWGGRGGWDRWGGGRWR